MNREYTKRLEYLVKEEGVDKLNRAKIMICGCGGVGSNVAEALARSGVGHLVLVDFDKIDITNLNRQLMTNKENIGKSKVLELAKHLELISDCEVETRECFIDANFKLDADLDYVVDCIDVLTSKFELVKMCHSANIPVLSSLGTAKRLCPDGIKYTTLDKTRNDPLAKAFRNIVKKNHYNHKIEVVFIDSPSIQEEMNLEGNTSKERNPLGSSIFTVGSAGLYIAYIVCKKIWEE